MGKSLLEYLKEQYDRDKKAEHTYYLKRKEGIVINYIVVLIDYTAPSYGNRGLIRLVLQEIETGKRKSIYIKQTGWLFDKVETLVLNDKIAICYNIDDSIRDISLIG